MRWTYVIIGAALLLVVAWALRRAWRSFALEMEGYEFSEDVERIHASRRRAQARREALARMVGPCLPRRGLHAQAGPLRGLLPVSVVRRDTA